MECQQTDRLTGWYRYQVPDMPVHHSIPVPDIRKSATGATRTRAYTKLITDRARKRLVLTVSWQ